MKKSEKVKRVIDVMFLLGMMALTIALVSLKHEEKKRNSVSSMPDSTSALEIQPMGVKGLEKFYGDAMIMPESSMAWTSADEGWRDGFLSSWRNMKTGEVEFFSEAAPPEGRMREFIPQDLMFQEIYDAHMGMGKDAAEAANAVLEQCLPE